MNLQHKFILYNYTEYEQLFQSDIGARTYIW